MEKLHFAVHSRCLQQPASYRVEEGLGQFYVMLPGNQGGISFLSRTPNREVSCTITETGTNAILKWLYFSGHTDLDRLVIRQGGVSHE